MSWGIAGSSPFSDLAKTEHVLVKELLEAQWSLTGALAKFEPTAAPDGVRFGTGWGIAVVSPYEVHCLSAPSPAPRPFNNGWTVYEYRPKVDIHVFARRSTNAEPAQPGQMQREIDRILATFKASVSAGVLVTPAAWRAAHDPENVGPAAYWHLVGSCVLLYCKVNSAN